MYIMEVAMQVSKWGNSLAVRLPKELVEAAGLRDGDDLEVLSMTDGAFKLRRKLTREEAWKRLQETRIPVPPGFKFDRNEANER
jgi:antitoxin MazE